MTGSSLVVPPTFCRMGREWGRGCSNERAPEASGLLDTRYLDRFGGGWGGRIFTLPIEHSELWRVGLR